MNKKEREAIRARVEQELTLLPDYSENLRKALAEYDTWHDRTYARDSAKDPGATLQLVEPVHRTIQVRKDGSATVGYIRAAVLRNGKLVRLYWDGGWRQGG